MKKIKPASQPWVTLIEIERESDTGNTTALLEFVDGAGSPHRHAFPTSTPPLKMLTYLRSKGAVGIPSKVRIATEELSAAISPVGNRPVRTTSVAGWQDDDTYVFPDEVIGENPSGLRLSWRPEGLAAKAGLVRKWKDGLSEACSKSSILPIVIAAAFAAPLLRRLSRDGFPILQLTGGPVSDRELALRVALSARGPADEGQIMPMGVTSPRTIGRLDEWRDQIVAFTTLGTKGRRKAVRRQLSDTAKLMVAGRVVEAKTATVKKVRAIAVCMHSEASDCTQQLASADIIELPLHLKRGLFELTPDPADRNALVNRVNETIERHYGQAARRFVAKVISDNPRENFKQHRDAFIAAARKQGVADVSWIRDIAIIVAAGCLAIDFELAPFTHDELTMAALHFASLEHSRISRPFERAKEVLAVLGAASLDQRRFPIVQEGHAFPQEQIATAEGFQRDIKGREVLAIFPAHFDALVQTQERNAVLAALRGMGALLPGKESDRFVAQIKVLGYTTAKPTVLRFIKAKLDIPKPARPKIGRM